MDRPVLDDVRRSLQQVSDRAQNLDLNREQTEIDALQWLGETVVLLAGLIDGLTSRVAALEAGNPRVAAGDAVEQTSEHTSD